MAPIEVINPTDIQRQHAATGKAMGVSKDFNAWLDAVGAMQPMGMTVNEQYGSSSPTSQAVLASAFSGVQSTNVVTAGASYPSLAGGGGALAEYAGPRAGLYQQAGGAIPGADQAAIPGTEGFTTGDLINTMNTNNLHLLELQATMQSNMQAWNTKSNILSADHRARMAMIEKFTARQ